MQQDHVIRATRQWVQTLVVDLNLCPFAQLPLRNAQVRFVVSAATTPDQLLAAVKAELLKLADDASIETTLLIHPEVLTDFYAYNNFLTCTDALLARHDWDGVFQIASFHPHYQFADSDPDDVENYTNRSPYPMLHLLREESVEQAIARHGAPEDIPKSNIARLRALGVARVRALRDACFDKPS